MEPAQLSADDFFKRWKQIGGAPREAQKVFGLGSKYARMDNTFTNKTAVRFKWGILQGVDNNSKNVVAACVLHTVEGGKFGCLMRLEPNYETMVSPPWSILTRRSRTNMILDVPNYDQSYRRICPGGATKANGGEILAGLGARCLRFGGSNVYNSIEGLIAVAEMLLDGVVKYLNSGKMLIASCYFFLFNTR
jgi:hypothetical protein